MGKHKGYEMSQLFTLPSPLNTKKKLFVIGGSLLLVALLAGTYFVFFHDTKKVSQSEDGPSPYVGHLSTLEAQQPPADPLSKAFYYGQIGMSNYELKQYDKALTNYVKAQQIIDDNGLRMQYTFYQAIADTYKAKGNKQQEKVYLEKHLAYLKEYLEQIKPDDGGTTLNAIKVYEERIKNL